MKVLSLNTGGIRVVDRNGEKISTGIFKVPAGRRLRVEKLGIVGDRQADETVHGGEFKAVYSYAWEHYDYWKKRLGRDDLTPGMFGENLTTEGLDEDSVCIGDIFAVDNVLLEAVQQRLPCYKLGIRLNDPLLNAHL